MKFFQVVIGGVVMISLVWLLLTRSKQVNTLSSGFVTNYGNLAASFQNRGK